jgi:transcriptional regulator with XRE-family HTH domain
MSGESQQSLAARPVGIFESLRRARGLKQLDLAERVGVSRSYIAMVEQGWRPPAHRQEAIAAALDVEVTRLWPAGHELSLNDERPATDPGAANLAEESEDVGGAYR